MLAPGLRRASPILDRAECRDRQIDPPVERAAIELESVSVSSLK